MACKLQGESSNKATARPRRERGAESQIARRVAALLQLPLDTMIAIELGGENAQLDGFCSSEGELGDGGQAFVDVCRLFEGLGERSCKAYLTAASSLRQPLMRLLAQLARGVVPPGLRPVLPRQARGLRALLRLHENMMAALRGEAGEPGVTGGGGTIVAAVRIAVEAMRQLLPRARDAGESSGAQVTIMSPDALSSSSLCCFCVALCTSPIPATVCRLLSAT